MRDSQKDTECDPPVAAYEWQLAVTTVNAFFRLLCYIVVTAVDTFLFSGVYVFGMLAEVTACTC